MEKKKNRLYWNIIKGIGILCIVIGHSWKLLSGFVYLFHLAVFFFVGGYLYNDEKYSEDPYLYFANKLKNNWKKYVLFEIILILLHNLFIKMGILLNSDYYDFDQTVISAISTLLFFGSETLGGALWFVPVYVIASAIFGSIISFAKSVSKNYFDDNEVFKNILILLLGIVTGILGLYVNYKGMSLWFHSQTSILVVPFFIGGYFLKNITKNYDKIFNFIGLAISFGILLLITYRYKISIELSQNIVGNVYLYYFISFIGIYFCLCLGNLILKIRYLNKYFELLGKYSFEIMGSHFVIFKLFDYFTAKVVGIVDSNIYGVFPCAFPKCWYFYIILGINIPIAFFEISHRIKAKKITKHSILAIIKKYKKVILYILILILIILFSLPILKLGIMQNDELISRFWSSQGFVNFYKHYFIEEIEKGRTLSALTIPASMYLGFLSQNTYIFKAFQVLMIVLPVIFFGNLLKDVFDDQKIKYIFIALFLAILPITFEPTVPNVFVTLYNVYVCLLILSFKFYLKYLDSFKSKELFISILLYCICLVSYEAFVTYVPVFLILYVIKKGFKDIQKDFKAIVVPVICGLTYIILYFIFSKIFPSNYGGNQIGNLDIIRSVKIIFNLIINIMPGSYLINNKYDYIYNYYLGNFRKRDLIRIILLTLVFLIIMIIAISNIKKAKKVKTSKIIGIIICGIMLIILPLVPISVSSMYQNIDFRNNVFALPVSFFSYFGVIFILSYILKLIADNYLNLKYAVIIPLVFCVFGIQKMNAVISNEAAKNFTRLEYIENFISNKEILSKFENDNIYSPSIYLTKNALAIHDGYWSDFSIANNININYLNETPNFDNVELVYDDSKNIFYISKEDSIYLFTDNEIEDILINNKNIYLTDEYKQIGNKYVYHLKKKKKKNDYIVCKSIFDEEIFGEC